MGNAYPELGDTMRRARRRVILEILSSTPDGQSGELFLEPVLNSRRIRSDRDQVRTELAWLQDQGLVALEEIAGDMFATILSGGRAIAEAKRVHPDIEKRPDKRRL